MLLVHASNDLKQFLFYDAHYVKSVYIRSFCGPYFPAFRLNMETYSVNLRIQCECGKIWSRKTPNKDLFYAVAKCNFSVHPGYLILSPPQLRRFPFDRDLDFLF